MTLADYMNSYMGIMATELGWTVASGSYSFPVAETLEVCGVTTEAEETNTQKLHAIGKVKVLEAARMATVNAIDFTADSSSFRMSQLNAQITDMLRSATIDASPYLYAIEVGEFTYSSDPYKRLENLYDRDDDGDELDDQERSSTNLRNGGLLQYYQSDYGYWYI
jgi:hypothetical protein